MSLFFRLIWMISLALSMPLVFAAGFIDYTPANYISLSGSSSDVRFDVHQVLFDGSSPVSHPTLNTLTKFFSGAFYARDIGWINFSTGTYSTKIDCGSQYLSGLTSNCVLSGSAWSETIGTILFDRRVEYLYDRGTLSGRVSTYMGDLSLDGVMLPLLPASLSGSTYSGMANHITPYEITHHMWYSTSGGLWEVKKTPFGMPVTFGITGPIGVIDFSLANSYTVSIQDPNGSITKYQYDVRNNVPSMSLDPNIDFTHKKFFCFWYPLHTSCPDGATLSQTVISHTVGGVSNTTTIADGQSRIDVRVKIRDRYGNAIKSGELQFNYNTPITTNQTNPLENILFPISLPGSAVLVDTLVMQNNGDGTSSSLPLSMNGQDIVYNFRSVAPGTIQLMSFLYDGGVLPFTPTPLTFTDWYRVTGYIADDIRIGSGFSLTGTVINRSSRGDTNPIVTSVISLGNNLSAYMSDIPSDVADLCQAYSSDILSYASNPECAWNIIGTKTFPTVLARTLSPVGGEIIFSGIYRPILSLPYVPPEPVTIDTFISYTIEGKDVVYPSSSYNLGNSEYQNMRIRILGQSNIGGWYTGLSAEQNNQKVEFYNTTRKNVALLTRNRTDYTLGDIYYTGNSIQIDDAEFDQYRTIVTIGGDITIGSDILERSKPVAVIALRDPVTGSGGRILIHTGVSDIHASLIAEKYLTTSGSTQLYIRGTVISNNTIGGSTLSPLHCPYFENSACTFAIAERYDLEQMRDDYLTLPDRTLFTASSPTAIRYPDTSLIIEYDPRIQTDPPPTFSR